MKLIIRGTFIFITVVLLTIICLDISTSNVREVETITLSNNSAYQSIKTLANGSYNIESEDELVAEAIKDIVMNKQSDSDIKIQVLNVDAENGLMDINVIQTIHHLNGKTTTSEERRTVILEKTSKENQ
ncbi:hypothetical protein [Clostridium sp.]|jgi:hypothetical protein|uniref:hypothetical protein n=1 Tax=Clostridium sp. TaxID=1506 RepID=UPI0028FE722A|nr:hypothetical protein [Clostridium sp.]MDU2155280.1 hypothetical protein [Clostridium sp.]